MLLDYFPLEEKSIVNHKYVMFVIITIIIKTFKKSVKTENVYPAQKHIYVNGTLYLYRNLLK